MSNKVEKTGEMHVVDEVGNALTMSIFTTFTLYSPLSGSQQWIPGTKAYQLNGEHCNPIDADTWKTLKSNKILRRA